MSDRPPGPTLARYHLGEALGAGPTGEVFRGKVFGVAGFERQFAVKRFYRSLTAQPAALKALADAARRYQTIEHPRIARLHEFGHEGEQYFAAVELVPGLDLSRLISLSHGQGHALPAGAALGLLTQLLRAVAYAQGRQVHHLGISPSNVIATADGDGKITDFGFLAARLPPKPAAEANLLSRLSYLAPEQLDGASGSAATDVFQLGALGVELITGHRAFTGSTAHDIAALIRSGRAALDGVPTQVVDAFARALVVAPSTRWANAGLFADALEAALRQAPLQGGRSDVGAAVRRAQQRQLELEAEQLSGALVFPLPAAPPTGAMSPVQPLVRPTPPDVAPMRIPSDGFSVEGTTSDNTPLPPAYAPVSQPSLPTIELDPSRDLLPASGEHQRGMTLTDPEELIATGIQGGASRLPLPPRTSSVSGASLPQLAAQLEGGGIVASRPVPAPRPRRVGLAIVLGLVIAGGGGFFVWQHFIAGGQPPKPTVAVTPRPQADAATPPGHDDAGTHVAVAAIVDAGVRTADAGSGQSATRPPAPVPPTPNADGKWHIASSPSAASVWIDGKLAGKTPLDLPGAAGKHRVAIILLGHALHRAEVDGQGELAVTLADATGKPGGPGRIKVRCKTKGLYISVDGVGTGELCPSDRISTQLGKITVETYDPASDVSHSHEEVVKPPTHGSQRVRLGD